MPDWNFTGKGLALDQFKFEQAKYKEEEDKRRREKIMDDLAIAKIQNELESSGLTNKRKLAGQEALGRYGSTLASNKKTDDTMAGINLNGLGGTPTLGSDQGSNLPADYAKGLNPSNREIADREGLYQYTESNPEIKELYSRFEKDRAMDLRENKTNASGTAKRVELFNRIKNAETQEEADSALDDYMLFASPSLADAGITQAGKRSATVEDMSRGAKTKTAASTAAASTSAKLDAEKGRKTLSESAAQNLGDFGASISQVNELLAGIDQPDLPQGPIQQWMKINPYDWKAQGKQQLVAATKQLVGKALEGGVLRKEDEDKYAKILPTMGDTYESAVQKSRNLQSMLNNAYAAKRDALKAAGYDVSGFGATLNSNSKKDDFDSFWNEINR